MSWQVNLKDALTDMLREVEPSLGPDHFEGTPDRVTRMFEQCFFGPSMEAAKAVLRTGFKHDVVSEMVHISRVQFVSFCAHHLSPFLCTGYFAYVPDGIIVGLSKIPRTIEIVANRPQVQETLTDQVVEIFDATVKPRGCGFVVDAVHMCMVSRGIKKSGISVRTSALRGCFFEAATKQEFFSAIPRSS